MSSIESTIALRDNMSSVLTGIIDVMRQATGQMEELNRTVSEPLDASAAQQSLEGVAESAQRVAQESAQAFSRANADKLVQNLEAVNGALETMTQNILAANSALENLAQESAPDIEPVSVPVEPLHIPSEVNLSAVWDPVSLPISDETVEISALYDPEPLPIPPEVNIPVVLEPESIPEPESVEIPVVWQTESGGPERITQIGAQINAMLNMMVEKQQMIANNAASMSVFPDNAVTDIQAMITRMQDLQSELVGLDLSADNVDFDVTLNRLNQMQREINDAVSAQNTLNSAVDRMDVSEANAAYNMMNSRIERAERTMDSLSNAQAEFNNQVSKGDSAFDGLLKTIKSAVAAYAGIRGVKLLASASDELVSVRARINQMNDGLQSTDELMNMVYESAQRARGNFSDMASVVARFGNNAKDAFASSTEAVQFAELVQKQMTIAGASTSEASNAILQLSQALGSGVLRGDELNSIFEQAPNLIQNIADYLGVAIGDIREMATEGELSADIVKNAVFAAADDIEQKFSSMPVTWSQTMTVVANAAQQAFMPVLQMVNNIANSEQASSMLNGIVTAMSVLAATAEQVFNVMEALGSFMHDNWSVIAPFIMGAAAALAIYIGFLIAYNTIQKISNAIEAISAAGIALKAGATLADAAATTTATGAQAGLNAAIAACPITWIIVAIIAAIAVIYAVCAAIAKLTGVANTGFGVITGGINVVIQFFKNLGLEVANIALGIGSAISTLCGNIMTAFKNTIKSVQAWWYNLLSTCMTVIEKICAALNRLPFVEFDYSGIASAADDYAARSAEAAAVKGEYQSVAEAYVSAASRFNAFSDGWASEAFSSGADWGDGAMSKLSGWLSSFSGGTDLSSILSGTALDGITVPESTRGSTDSAADAASAAENASDALTGIATDTAAIADSVSLTDEEIELLREIAERGAVNRFTTAEVKLYMENHNTIDSAVDIDGMYNSLMDLLEEGIQTAAEGVHV